MDVAEQDFLAFTLSKSSHQTAFQYNFKGGVAYFQGRGIVRIEPIQSAQGSLVLSAGIHGNETAPMELLNQIVHDILADSFTLQVRVLVIIGHPEATKQGKRFCDVNLNRLFCGAWRQYEGQEVQRAQQLEQAVAEFFAQHCHGEKLHYDLHTAIRGSQYEKFVIHPFTHGQAYHSRQFGFYKALDIEAVLLSHQPTTTFSYHSYVTHQAQAATIELGQVRPFGQNDLSKLAAFKRALITYLTSGSLPQMVYESIKVFQVIDVLTKDADDYSLNIAVDEKNFTGYEQGFVLAQSSIGHYEIKQTGDAIVFPNVDLPIGQRSGLVVRQVAWDRVKRI